MTSFSVLKPLLQTPLGFPQPFLSFKHKVHHGGRAPAGSGRQAQAAEGSHE